MIDLRYKTMYWKILTLRKVAKFMQIPNDENILTGVEEIIIITIIIFWAFSGKFVHWDLYIALLKRLFKNINFKIHIYSYIIG